MDYIPLFLCLMHMLMLIGPYIAMRDAHHEFGTLVSCIKNLRRILQVIKAGVHVEWSLKTALREHNPDAVKLGAPVSVVEIDEVPEAIPGEHPRE